MKTIEVFIDNDGNIKIETRGFTGKSCIVESQFIKDLLGVEKARALTPTYFGKEKNQVIKKHLNLCG